MAWFRQLNLAPLLEILVTAAASWLCISFHEMCHGLMALRLGDPTAKNAGRISLNPLRHIDPVGLVLMITVRFGWAKGVPVDIRNFKKPKEGMALTALAGPLSNLVLAIAAMVLYAVAEFYFRHTGLEILSWVSFFFLCTAILSIGLGVFNLIPVPPSDGSKILAMFLPVKIYVKLMRYERYGMIAMAVLLFTGVLSGPLTAARTWVLDLLWPLGQWVFDLLVSIYY